VIGVYAVMAFMHSDQKNTIDGKEERQQQQQREGRGMQDMLVGVGVDSVDGSRVSLRESECACRWARDSRAGSLGAKEIVDRLSTVLLDSSAIARSAVLLDIA